MKKGIFIAFLASVALLFGFDAFALPATFAADAAAAVTDAENGKTLIIAGVVGIAIISFGVAAILSWLR